MSPSDFSPGCFVLIRLKLMKSLLITTQSSRYPQRSSRIPYVIVLSRIYNSASRFRCCAVLWLFLFLACRCEGSGAVELFRGWEMICHSASAGYKQQSTKKLERDSPIKTPLKFVQKRQFFRNKLISPCRRSIF